MHKLHTHLLIAQLSKWTRESEVEGMQQLWALISHMDHSLNSDRGLFPLMWGKIYRKAVPLQPCLGQMYFFVLFFSFALTFAVISMMYLL